MAVEVNAPNTAQPNPSASPDQSMESAASQQAAQPASATDAAPSPESGDSQASASSQEQHSRIGDFFGRFLRGAPDTDAATASADQTTEPAPSTDDDAEQPGADASTQSLTLTQEEIHRLVQAETDREINRRQTIQQQRESEAERRRKRREDPIGYAQDEEEREAETAHAGTQAQQQLQTVNTALRNVAQEFDAQILNPIFYALPEDQRAAVYGQGPVGIDGRVQFVQKSLQALEKTWKAQGAKDGERAAIERLRQDQPFRKQLYHEFRGTSSEPLVAPAAAATGNGQHGSGDPLRDLLTATPAAENAFPT